LLAVASASAAPSAAPCGDIRATVPTQIVEPSPEFVAEIVKLARHAKCLEGEAELAFAAHRAAQQDLKDRLSANNVRRIDSDGVRLTWSAVKGRPSYDMKAIRGGGRCRRNRPHPVRDDRDAV